MKIIKQSIFLDDVLEYDKKKYNTSNHGDRPSDYFEKLELCETKNWVCEFHNERDVITYKFKPSDIYWMREASNFGRITGQVSSSAKEDIEDFLKEEKNMEFSNKYFNNQQKYFVRTDTVSLKTGVHGVGPYSSFKSIIESMITCLGSHSPLSPDISYVTLYLLPWKNIIKDKEFRVFVHNRQITAISQQHLYQRNELLSKLDETRNITIDIYVTEIVYYFEDIIKPILEKCLPYLNSYCIDIALLEDNKPYFIEINTFGKEYTSGSSLYHWILDEEILYDSKNEKNIYFRYVI